MYDYWYPTVVHLLCRKSVGLEWSNYMSEVIKVRSFEPRTFLWVCAYNCAWKYISLGGNTQCVLYWLGCHSRYSNWMQGGHPPPPNAKLRMGRSYTSISPTCLHKHVRVWPSCYPLYRRAWAAGPVWTDVEKKSGAWIPWRSSHSCILQPIKFVLVLLCPVKKKSILIYIILFYVCRQ